MLVLPVMPETQNIPTVRATRLFRLVTAVGFACAALASSPGALHAEAHRPAHVLSRGKPAPASRAKPATKSKGSARERANARAKEAAARMRETRERVAARREESRSRLALSRTFPALRFGALSAAERLRDSVVAVARAQIGVPYVLGGNTPRDGFDCSGLVKYVMDAFHVRLPRTAAEQAEVGTRVARDPDHLKPGDLLTFAVKGEGVSHIGIYVGDGRMVHASTAAGAVIETALIRAPSKQIKPWLGARRLVAASDPPDSGGQ
jgi:cell wall-associated NlpC family hydrolase